MFDHDYRIAITTHQPSVKRRDLVILKAGNVKRPRHACLAINGIGGAILYGDNIKRLGATGIGCDKMHPIARACQNGTHFALKIRTYRLVIDPAQNGKSPSMPSGMETKPSVVDVEAAAMPPAIPATSFHAGKSVALSAAMK